MIRNVTEYLDYSAEKYPDKTAFVDRHTDMTYSELKNAAYHLAMGMIKEGIFKKPVGVYLEKSVQCIAAFMGAAYAGNFYSPLDTEMPLPRIEKIMDTLQPAVIVTDEAHRQQAESFAKESLILVYEKLQNELVDEEKIHSVSQKVIDTDILYVLFTSGSTGTPKGVIISHRALIDFTEWGTERFDIDDGFIFGNQTPFYFSMSVFDIYQTLKNGAAMYIVPKEMFSFPVMLMQYLYDHDINTVFWVPSALMLVAAFKALESPYLPKLRNVFFGGEVMPVKQLNKWIEKYPDCRYVNFYGPTEVTDTCTVYEVNRKFENSERLPMGEACANMDVFLLDEEDRPPKDGEIGEICVRGSGISYGYYHDEEKTREAFVQNPLNHCCPETIYRTGDLAYVNEYGEFVYVSRKDFQIKHMGHRIELGEIETAVSSVKGVESNCCIYDQQSSRIIMYYTGTADGKYVMERLKEMLPVYMLPNKRIHLEEMPFNLNGKIDRQRLKEMGRGNK